jgi:hypothetical protein
VPHGKLTREAPYWAAAYDFSLSVTMTRVRCNAVGCEWLADESLRGLGITAFLDKCFQYEAILINSTHEPIFAIDRDDNFIQVPLARASDDVSCWHKRERTFPPISHGLMRDGAAFVRQHVFAIRNGERKYNQTASPMISGGKR